MVIQYHHAWGQFASYGVSTSCQACQVQLMYQPTGSSRSNTSGKMDFDSWWCWGSKEAYTKYSPWLVEFITHKVVILVNYPLSWSIVDYGSSLFWPASQPPLSMIIVNEQNSELVFTGWETGCIMIVLGNQLLDGYKLLLSNANQLLPIMNHQTFL